jgi:capsular exopolysaccharide synthesis family protein
MPPPAGKPGGPPLTGTLLPVLSYPRGAGTESAVPPALAAHPDVFKLLKALRRRWLLALCLGLLCAGGAMVATYMVLPPGKYTARVLLRVDSTPPKLLFNTAERQTDYGTYQRTQQVLIKSRLVLNTALRNPKVAELAVIKTQFDPVEWLDRRVGVDFVGGSEVMRISVSGDNEQDIVTLVNAVTEAYLTEVVNKERIERMRRMDQLREQLTRLEGSLREKRKLLKQLAQNAGSSQAEVLTIKQKTNQDLLARTKTQLQDYLFQRQNLEFKLKAYQAQEKTSEHGVSENQVLDEMAKDPNVIKIKARIAALEENAEEVKRRATRGEADPAVKNMRRQIQEQKDALVERQTKIRPATVESLRNVAKARARDITDGIRDQIAFYSKYIEMLGEEEKRLEDGDKKTNEYFLDLEANKEEIAHTEALTKRIGAEVATMDVELKAPERVGMLDPATVSNTNDVAKQLQTAGLAGLGAFGVILLGIALQEFRARRLDTADDVVTGLGIKVIGSLPALPNRYRSRAAAGTAGPQDHHWQQLLMESVDATRTMLLYAAKTEGVRVVMISSAVSGEGKTSLSCHLATSLARAGRKTLLVDCDLRRPATHRLFEVDLAPGLCEVLREEANLADAVRTTTAGNLFHLPAGKCSPQAIELLAQEALPRVLNQLRPEYDFLILDTSPILAVNDTMLVAQHVDGVLFSLLRDVSRMPAVYAAYQRLCAVGIRPMGAVVAGVRGDGYGYSYYYGYGYGYGYGTRTGAAEAPKDQAAAEGQK